jgi:hypothetical protein
MLLVIHVFQAANQQFCNNVGVYPCVPGLQSAVPVSDVSETGAVRRHHVHVPPGQVENTITRYVSLP